ncbi:unnamed protein product [Phytophthora fragariaefolia]|uniref:Unnamed protein product n=1 Tax=Phytophthora fragariaefolia TaxID=1490495 RepID=A0A9W6XG27_9STRA|nr:unnamed protein product [Phytophthora fragariaefolia]
MQSWSHTPASKLSSCKEVCQRGLRPTKKGPQANCSKAGYIALFRYYDRTNELYGEIALSSGSQRRKATAEQTTKTKHCMFRLINVLFSDKFAQRFAENNGPVSRTDLDRGAVNRNPQFWTYVASSFAEDRLEYGWLVASHPKFGGIRPSIVTVHNGVKLRGMWGEITSEYQRCLNNFNSESGTHAPDFYSFCYDRIDMLYLHFWLEKILNLLAAVAGRLVDAAQVDTMREAEEPRRHTGKTNIRHSDWINSKQKERRVSAHARNGWARSWRECRLARRGSRWSSLPAQNND